jgi:hypothetical protein
MKRLLFLLTATSLVLAACNNDPTPDIETPAVVTAAAQPGTGVRPTAFVPTFSPAHG